MRSQIDVEFVLNPDLTPFDKECVCEASKRFEKTYGNIFSVTSRCSNVDLSKNHLSETSKSVLGEPLLEDIVESSMNDITFLIINVPIISVGKGILPIAMFCYDTEKKKASALISVDILYSSIKAEYVKNILINIEHEVGEIILGEHCDNRRCPLHFHIHVSDMKFSKEEYCEKCYRRILANIVERFNHR